MKQGLEGRLRRLEIKQAAELNFERGIELCWLTEEEINRGVRPGLYEIPDEDLGSPDDPGSREPDEKVLQE